MAYVNEVTLNGRVVRDAERKGNGPWRFTLVQRGGTKKDSQERYPDNFFPVACWDSKAADIMKGMELDITGRLRPTSWEKDGVKHTGFEIVAKDVILPLTPTVRKSATALDRTMITDEDAPF